MLHVFFINIVKVEKINLHVSHDVSFQNGVDRWTLPPAHSQQGPDRMQIIEIEQREDEGEVASDPGPIALLFSGVYADCVWWHA
jgi:hypothetical protein